MVESHVHATHPAPAVKRDGEQREQVHAVQDDVHDWQRLIHALPPSNPPQETEQGGGSQRACNVAASNGYGVLRFGGGGVPAALTKK